VGTTSCRPRTSSTSCGSPPHAWGPRFRTHVVGCLYGSPPHAWGPRRPGLGHPVQLRFTPTRVGTTLPGVRCHDPGAVHPHTRGDHVTGLAPGATKAVHPHTRGDHLKRGGRKNLPPGSPPHAWGPPRPRRHRHSFHRFTPTRVGTT